jgi:hypothetical protein
MDVIVVAGAAVFPFSHREKEGPIREANGRMRGYGVSGQSGNTVDQDNLEHRNPSPSQPSAGPLPLPMGEVFH